MRKFPKLVAIVLAIAIVICPAMCLSAMADSPNSYSLSYDEGVLTITVTSETGFMVSYLNVDIEGYAVDEENITVTTEEGRAFSANPIFEDGVLALLVAPTEAYDISLVTEAVVSVPLEELVEVERYYIALTKIQAADAGSAEVPESFLVFDGVDANGYVEEVIPTVDALPHECDVVEYVDNGDGTHNGVCDCEDATVLIENEDHIDEDADNVCDYCLADIDNGGSEEPEDPICEHVWEVVSATPATESVSGSIVLNCKNCDDADGTTKAVEWNRYSRPMYTGLLLESELIYTQSVRYEQDLSRVGTADGWSDLYLQFVEEGSAEPTLINVAEAEDAVVSSKACYKFSYGVASTGLLNSIATYAYTYNEIDDKWYSGENTVESVASYAKQMLPTATELQKTLLVDVLNYGAAAQIAFNYNVDNLPNADLVIGGVDYSTYGTDGEVTAVDGSTAASSSTAQYPLTVPSFGAECESRLILNVEFQFGKSYYASYVDQYDGMYVDVSYTNVFGEDRVVRYYNSTVSDSDFTFTQIAGNDRRFRFAFNDFSAGDMRNRITFKVYTADGTLLNSDSSYCIEDYVAITRTTSSNAAMITLVNEMLQFGDSANAFILSK